MDDNDLLEKIKNKETRNYGFNLLVRKYQQKVYYHIRRMVIDHDETDDLVQDTFIKVYNNIHKFRADAQLFTWIYRIATNTCLNHLNKKKRRLIFSLTNLDHEMAAKLESAPYITGDEIQLKLQKALLTLPPKQRLVFNMKYYDDMKYDKIAEITGTSTGALKASYHHAVKKIEEYLKKH